MICQIVFPPSRRGHLNPYTVFFLIILPLVIAPLASLAKFCYALFATDERLERRQHATNFFSVAARAGPTPGNSIVGVEGFIRLRSQSFPEPIPTSPTLWSPS